MSAARRKQELRERSEYELRASPDSAKAFVFHSGDDPVAFLGASRQFLRRVTP